MSGPLRGVGVWNHPKKVKKSCAEKKILKIIQKSWWVSFHSYIDKSNFYTCWCTPHFKILIGETIFDYLFVQNSNARTCID